MASQLRYTPHQPNLVSVVSQYEVLLYLSRHLTYPELRRLGSTNRDLYSLLLGNRRVKDKLKSLTTCSGAGLALRRSLMRQTCMGIPDTVRRHPDEDVKNIVADDNDYGDAADDGDDEADDFQPAYVFSEEDWDTRASERVCTPYTARGCSKCGEPVCESCRSTPRSDPDPADLPRDMDSHVPAPASKPFTGRLQYLIAYCADCITTRTTSARYSTGFNSNAASSDHFLDPAYVSDTAATSELAPRGHAHPHTFATEHEHDHGHGHGNGRVEYPTERPLEYCGCDRYERWICHPCQQAEKRDFLRFTRRHVGVGVTIGSPESRDGSRGGGDVDSGTGNRIHAMDVNDAMYMPVVTGRGSHISMMLCPCGQPAHRMSHIWCFLCSKPHRSTVHRLRTGDPWRTLWYGKDEDWDEEWSL